MNLIASGDTASAPVSEGQVRDFANRVLLRSVVGQVAPGQLEYHQALGLSVGSWQTAWHPDGSGTSTDIGAYYVPDEGIYYYDFSVTDMIPLASDADWDQAAVRRLLNARTGRSEEGQPGHMPEGDAIDDLHLPDYQADRVDIMQRYDFVVPRRRRGAVASKRLTFDFRGANNESLASEAGFVPQIEETDEAEPRLYELTIYDLEFVLSSLQKVGLARRIRRLLSSKFL